MFNEITANAVKKAFDDRRSVNTNLEQIQLSYGHASLTTTERYLGIVKK